MVACGAEGIVFVFSLIAIDLCVDDIEIAMLGVISLLRAWPPKVDALVKSLHWDGLQFVWENKVN